MATIGIVRPTTWHVLDEVSLSVSTTWRVAGPTSIVRTTSWNVFAAVSLSRVTSWNVRSEVTLSRSTTWDVTSCITPPETTGDPCNPCAPDPEACAALDTTGEQAPVCAPCVVLATSVFKRINVDYLVQGGARISWELNEHFIDPMPHTFQLQSSPGGVPTADDWANVGSPVVDTLFTFDALKRLFGKTQTLSYRVVLTTSVGTYTSAPASILGLFTKRDWVIVREIIRKEQLRHTKFNSISGFLLKARRYGQPCSCLDPLTGEVIDAGCPDCGGSGFARTGYYHPVPAQYADITPASEVESRETERRGMIKPMVITGRFLGCLPLTTDDVWVTNGSDERYYMQTIKELAIWKGVPLMYEVELRQAPFTDPVYTVSVG